MSSRVFKAKSGHTPERPQLCGLSNREISKGDEILYLVIAGDNARPEYQIKVTREERKKVTFRGRTRTTFDRDYGMDNGRQFRSVFGGWQTNPDTGKREKTFEWQEKKGEVWSPIECWSHIALADVAEELGYDIRKRKNGKRQTTTAHDGDRAIGNEHTVNAPETVNAMEVLARAACTDEELGLVAPGTGPSAREKAEQFEVNETLEILEELRSESGVDEDVENAGLLGMSVEAYRKLQTGLVR